MRGRTATWVQDPNLLVSPEFLLQVFDKVNALRVAAKRTKKERARAQAALPKFEDFEQAQVSVWSANPESVSQASGMWLNLGKRGSYNGKWQCRLFPDYTLWSGIRAWRVYDGEPLWP